MVGSFSIPVLLSLFRDNRGLRFSVRVTSVARTFLYLCGAFHDRVKISAPCALAFFKIELTFSFACGILFLLHKSNNFRQSGHFYFW